MAKNPYELMRRDLPDGRQIVVVLMLYSTRLCIGPAGDEGYERAWCYPDAPTAVAAAHEWNGEGDPPAGWIKEAGTERRRIEGDPAREFVAEGEWPE